jgi:ISXO2-like transposase domain
MAGNMTVMPTILAVDVVATPSKGEYASGKGSELVTTNTFEGMFGVFKRFMVGVYQHCGEQHLQRYLDEFSFRWNNRSKLGVEDEQRAQIAREYFCTQILTDCSGPATPDQRAWRAG